MLRDQKFPERKDTIGDRALTAQFNELSRSLTGGAAGVQRQTLPTAPPVELAPVATGALQSTAANTAELVRLTGLMTQGRGVPTMAGAVPGMPQAPTAVATGIPAPAWAGGTAGLTPPPAPAASPFLRLPMQPPPHSLYGQNMPQPAMVSPAQQVAPPPFAPVTQQAGGSVVVNFGDINIRGATLEDAERAAIAVVHDKFDALGRKVRDRRGPRG